jgi:hypothetical protein
MWGFFAENGFSPELARKVKVATVEDLVLWAGLVFAQATPGRDSPRTGC